MFVDIMKALTHLFWLQGKMIMQDKLEKERNDAKNSVEEYVYDMRDKLHGMYEKFISESVSKLYLVMNWNGGWGNDYTVIGSF